MGQFFLILSVTVHIRNGDVYIQLQKQHVNYIYLSRRLCQTHHHGTCSAQTRSYGLLMQKPFGSPHPTAGSHEVQGTADAALQLFGEEGKC